MYFFKNKTILLTKPKTKTNVLSLFINHYNKIVNITNINDIQPILKFMKKTKKVLNFYSNILYLCLSKRIVDIITSKKYKNKINKKTADITDKEWIELGPEVIDKIMSSRDKINPKYMARKLLYLAGGIFDENSISRSFAASLNITPPNSNVFGTWDCKPTTLLKPLSAPTKFSKDEIPDFTKVLNIPLVKEFCIEIIKKDIKKHHCTEEELLKIYINGNNPLLEIFLEVMIINSLS